MKASVRKITKGSHLPPSRQRSLPFSMTRIVFQGGRRAGRSGALTAVRILQATERLLQQRSAEAQVLQAQAYMRLFDVPVWITPNINPNEIVLLPPGEVVPYGPHRHTIMLPSGATITYNPEEDL